MADKQLGAGIFQVDDNDEIHAFNRRWVIFSVALLANMVDRLVGLLGPVAKRQIYEAGFSSGKIAGDRMRQYFGGGIEQIKQHLDLIKNLGWGRIKDIQYDEGTGTLTIDFPGTWEAAGFGEANPDTKEKKATCILCAGLYAGAASGAFDAVYEGEEVLCVSKGDPVCRFEFSRAGEKKKVIR